MCVFAWQTRWFNRGDLKWLREFSIAMGEAHLQLQWGKDVWCLLWIEHMYFFGSRMATAPQMFFNGGEPPATKAHIAQ